MRRMASDSSSCRKRMTCLVSDCVPHRRCECRGRVSRQTERYQGLASEQAAASRGWWRAVYSEKSLRGFRKCGALLIQLDRAGRLRSADEIRLRQEERRLRASGICRSNDSHVLALAIVSGARTLATFDQALTDDFRDAEIVNGPRGSVYRDPVTHAHLLKYTPTSCGVRASAHFRRRRVR
jgi:hypothetical protein